MESDLLELGFGNYVQTSVLFSEYIITLGCAEMGVSLTRTHMNRSSGVDGYRLAKKKKRRIYGDEIFWHHKIRIFILQKPTPKRY